MSTQNEVIPAVPEGFEYPNAEVEYLNNTPVGGSAISHDQIMTPDISTIQNLTIMDLVQMFVVYAFIIAGALAAIFIFVGGISFILSGGDDEKIKKAVNTIRYSIIGLIVVILSFTVVTIVGRMFGLNLTSYVSLKLVKQSIERLIGTGERPGSSFDIQR